MIFMEVSTPISAVTSISSNSSYKSSSIVTAKFNTLLILSVNPSLVFVNPSFNLSKIFQT